ncbi:MAG: hypothetical protein DRQ40_06470 [Gammaproteobacteria bacterium]|nr:MAG: hypothetical protein DRQ40_06470 [Gammaproteobacteria bacterium]
MSAEDWIDSHYGESYDEPEVILDIKVLHETDKAKLIQHKNRQAWFPNSVISSLDDECMEYSIYYLPAWKQTGTKRMKAITGDF